MWCFTRYGFLSVACAQAKDGSIDSQTVMVRARRADHLRNLQARFPALAVAEIVTLPNRDYRYRLVVPKRVWVAALAEMAEEQEWSNFKQQVAEHQGRSAEPPTPMPCMTCGRSCTACNSPEYTAVWKYPPEPRLRPFPGPPLHQSRVST
jgi:hypothetical protein